MKLTITERMGRGLILGALLSVACFRPESSQAESFGIHFLGNTADPVTGAAGMSGITNWNNIANTTFVSGAIYSSDQAAAATLTMSGAGRSNGWNSGSAGDGGNGSLLNGYDDAGVNAPVTNVISGLTNVCYTIFIYAAGDQNRPSNSGDRLPNYQVNGITYYAAAINGRASGLTPSGLALYNSNAYPPAQQYGNVIEIDDVVPIGGVISISANADNRSFRSPLNGFELVADALPADVAIGAYNAAFLVQTNRLTYYANDLTNRSPDYFWVQALDIQALEDAYERTHSSQQQQLINALLTTFLSQNPEPWTWDGWNDDIGWVTLVMARGHQITGNSSFLNAAEYGFNLGFGRGWDTNFNGGGIWEQQGHDGKAPLSNDSLGQAACMIYQSTGNAAYLTKAEQIYAWVRTNIFNPTTGLVYEEVATNGTVNMAPALYNQGTFVDYAALLHKITGAAVYYNDARSAIEYARNNLTANSIFSNGALYLNTWAAEFARGLGHFVRYNNLWSTYYPWMVANANAAWSNRRTDLNLTWNAWMTPTPATNLITSWCASAVTMLQVTPTNEPGFVTSTNQLRGTVIGTAGSFGNSGNTASKVFDGNIATYFDAPAASGAWAGLDLGSANVIGQINYWPRAGWGARMVGGVFQGADNSSFNNAVTLFTIATAPPEDGTVTPQSITNTTAFRYVRYSGPANGWCNVAEVQFFAPAPPAPATGVSAVAVSASEVNLAWNASANATSYNVERGPSSGGPFTTIAAGLIATNWMDYGLTAGETYFYVVTAFSNGGSTDSVPAAVTLSACGQNVSSLDGSITATVDTISNHLVYCVSRLGRAVIEYSSLGPVLGTTNLGNGVTILSTTSYGTNETYASRHCAHAVATNAYAGNRFTISHALSGISYILDLRVFNAGVAFRYDMINAPATESVTGESSRFTVPQGSTLWYLTNNVPYDEWYYISNDISAIPAGSLTKPPLVIQLAGTNGFVALASADPGIFGAPDVAKTLNPGGEELQIVYPTNYDGTTGASLARADGNPWGASMAGAALKTPWNVVMVAPDLNALLNNDLVENLAPAPDPALFPQGAATPWITTGKSVWDYINPWPGGITMTNAMTNSFWAANLGFQYNVVDAGWSGWNGGNPWPQVKQLTSYSHSLGIKVLLWIDSSGLETESQRTAFYAHLVANAVDGFKADFWDWGPDFPDAADKVMLQQYVLREAATNHLVVAFHGIREPMGEFRTYPNLIQWKALIARDYYPQAWQATTIPLIRWLVGPADYGPENGAPYDYEVASMINMPGPVIILTQRPDGIAGNPFASLIVSIPNQWDQTIVLPQSQLGQTVAMARRKGRDWYVGIMNGNLNPPESWTVPLTFLTSGVSYEADLIVPNASQLVRTNVTSSSVLTAVQSQPNGGNSGAGFVAHIYPVPVTVSNWASSLRGTVIGTPGSWANSGNTISNVFDGKLSTFFDGPDAYGDWAGLDLGSTNQQSVSAIAFCPRSGWSSRMVGGVFQGASQADFSDAVNLATVGYCPQDGVFTTVAVTNAAAFRYVRYLGPANGYCDVAEVRFYGPASAGPSIDSNWDGDQLTLTWPGGGWLLEATNLVGPWITNLSAVPPISVAPSSPRKFYRVQY